MDQENDGAKQYRRALRESLRSQLGPLPIGTPFIFLTPSVIINAFWHVRSFSIHFLPLSIMKYTVFGNALRYALCRLISSAQCLAPFFNAFWHSTAQIIGRLRIPTESRVDSNQFLQKSHGSWVLSNQFLGTTLEPWVRIDAFQGKPLNRVLCNKYLETNVISNKISA